MPRRSLKTCLAACLTLLLAACSLQGLYESMVPDPVRAQSEALVDEIMAGDMSTVRETISQMPDGEPDGLIDRMSAEVRPGKETAREIVNLNSSVNAAVGEGRTSSYSVAHEVETPAGFTVITQTWVDRGDGPERDGIFIQGSDASLAVQLQMVATIAGIVGIVLLLGVLALVVVLVRRSRRKAENG